ncbi:MAG: pyridoxamine 5'-phosphate oxidase family protein [Saprospiraceae bacterium]
MKHAFKEIITTEAELRTILGTPSEVVKNKTITVIDKYCRKFIEHSPFLTIASTNGKGETDVSPKGDPAGFVKILDEKTLAIPERLGNKRADTFVNILHNPSIGLLFFIPGIKETLRVNGKAQIVTDLAIREQLTVKNRLPQFVLIVHVEEAFMHCSKCMVRSKLWTDIDPDIRQKVPTLAEIIIDHAKLEAPVDQVEMYLKESVKNHLY